MKNIYLALFLLFSCAFSTAQTKAELMDSLFRTLHERGQFSGNALVVSKGKAIYAGSFGLADRDRQILNEDQTLFNTGSVSMAATAVAILQLAEKGMLDVDRPVANYLSGFPYEKITIGHLLTHASGLPEIGELLPEWGNERLIRNNDVMEALYKQQPEPAFNPGTGSLFNHVGYIILAEIIEVISRMDFKAYLNNNVFQPAGMQHTGIYDATQVSGMPEAARGYFYSPFTRAYEEALRSTDVGNQFALSGTEGNSNMWSTTGDLLRLCEAISSNVLLEEEATMQMFLKKTDALMPGQTASYGSSFSYGWVIPDAPFRIALARGSLPGFNAEIVWNLSERRMIIFLSNDYLSFTSYNNLLPYTVGTLLSQDTLMIPKRYASIELANEVLHIPEAEIRDKIAAMRSDADHYVFDIAGMDFLVRRLRQEGELEKAELIDQLIRPE